MDNFIEIHRAKRKLFHTITDKTLRTMSTKYHKVHNHSYFRNRFLISVYHNTKSFSRLGSKIWSFIIKTETGTKQLFLHSLVRNQHECFISSEVIMILHLSKMITSTTHLTPYFLIY